MGDGSGFICEDCGESYGNYDWHSCSKLTLSELLSRWIEENFKDRIWLADGRLKAYGTIAGFTDINGGSYQVVIGRINDKVPWVRSRGKYFYPYEPDFFDKLKIEFEECFANPEINWIA